MIYSYVDENWHIDDNCHLEKTLEDEYNSSQWKPLFRWKSLYDENYQQCVWMKKHWVGYVASAYPLKSSLVTFCPCEWQATWAKNRRLWLVIDCPDLDKIILKSTTSAS